MYLTKSRIQIAATLLVACLLPMVAASAPIRVAVLNVGVGAGDVAAFSELIETALAGKDGIELLDRKTVDRILQEHELSLQDADQEAERAIQTGKLLAVDLFLLLEKVEQRDEPKQLLRIRTVETKYALKLSDYSIRMPTQDSLGGIADSIAKRTALLARKARPDPDNVLLVAVSGFRNIQAAMDTGSNSLSSTLSTSIENQLLYQPGVILLERNRIAPLTTERELVAGLPEALRTSAVFIDGEYELGHSVGNVSLTVRLSRASRDPQLMEFDETLGSIESLVQQIVAWITGQIGVKTPTPVLDPMFEADLLFAQAAVEKSQIERVALAEAALSLVPNNRNHQLRYLQYSSDKERIQSVFDRMMVAGRPGSGKPWTTDQAHLLSKALRKIDPYRPPSWGAPDQPMGLVNRDVWTALQILREHNQQIFYGAFIASAARLSNPSHARRALRDLCELVGGSSNLLQISALPSAEPIPSKISLAIYPSLFEELAESSDDYIVLAAKRGKVCMAMHGWQGATKAEYRKLYEDYETYLLQEIALKYNSHRYWFKPFLNQGKFYDDAEKDLQYKADCEERIAEFVLEHKLVGDLNWFGPWPECVSLLERTGRPADAVSLFRRIIEEARNVKDGKWAFYMERDLKRLLQRHPHLADTVDIAKLDEQYVARSIGSKDAFLALGNARRILYDDDLLALIYDKGVVRIEQTSLTLLDFQEIPKAAGNLLGYAVAEGHTIYAQCANGIVAIPLQGEKRILRYRHEIPGDLIVSYDVLHGKIYAVLTPAPYPVFAHTGNNMAEIEPITGINRILLSNTALIRGMAELNFKWIEGTFSDRANKRVFFSIWEGTSKSGTYSYSPAEEKVSKSIMEFGLGSYWRRRGNVLVRHNSSDVRFYDIVKGIQLARINEREKYGRLLRHPHLSFACRVGQGAVVQTGGGIEPVYYPPAEAPPQQFVPMLFPRRPNPPGIVDAIMHERGLLVLTTEGLYLSEGMLRLHHGNENRL